MAEQILVEAMSKKSYSSTILVVSTRELSGYVANDGTIFHHADSVSVMTITVFSLKSELLSQYWMPNVLVDVMSSNETFHNILFHRDLDI